MCKYRIVSLKQQYQKLSKFYPAVIKELYIQQDDTYAFQQTELIFDDLEDFKEELLHMLYQREDYSYYHGIHHLNNPITKERISMIFHKYDIEVEETFSQYTLYSMIQTISQNFYVIDL